MGIFALISSKIPVGGLPAWDDTADSGMFNMGHRNYAAGHLGRFISRDPIGHSGGLNLYAYPTNPVSFVDPSGLDTLFVYGGPAGKNPVAHSAIMIEGQGVWNLGVPGESMQLGDPGVIDFIQGQVDIRDVTLFELNSNSLQEFIMSDYLLSQNPTADSYADYLEYASGRTCNRPPTRALEKSLTIAPISPLESSDLPTGPLGFISRAFSSFPPLTALRAGSFSKRTFRIKKGTQLSPELREYLSSYEPFVGPLCPNNEGERGRL